MKKAAYPLAAVTAAALALTGCSTKAAEDTSSGGGDGGIKTEVGVTDSEIRLGSLTDHSGPFKSSGILISHGNEMWAKKVNAEGGVCERQIVINTQDTGYKPDNATMQYESMKSEDLGLIQLLGSATLAALKQKLTTDKTLSMAPTGASANLDTESIMVLGTTYDIETINGMDWLQTEGKIADGDKVGMVYMDNEGGQNSLLGAQHYAKEHNIELIEAPISASDNDMTTTVTKLKSEGVKAVVLMSSPTATASMALQNVQQGLNVPILGNSATYSPALVQNPSVLATLNNYFYSSPIQTASSNQGVTGEVLKEYQAGGYADPWSGSVLTGYLAGLTWEAILEQACENGDLTRDGIFEARKQVSELDSEGITGKLDLSDPGAPMTRETIIGAVDQSMPGGTKTVADFFVSDAAESYKAPYQK